MDKEISFQHKAFTDYLIWQTEDKKTFSKINNLIKEICREHYTGNGQPEQLKHELSGYWSRRINMVDRLVYQVEDDRVLIISCKGHYRN